jgi:hypothetical protein
VSYSDTDVTLFEEEEVIGVNALNEVDELFPVSEKVFTKMEDVPAIFVKELF